MNDHCRCRIGVPRTITGRTWLFYDSTSGAGIWEVDVTPIRTAVAVALTAAALTVPATARADEAGFLDRVHAAAMPLTDAKALLLGRAACTDLGNGIAVSAILAAQNPAVGDGPHLSGAQNWELFSAAIAELCPQLQSGY